LAERAWWRGSRYAITHAASYRILWDAAFV
jgi:hypothetical protein